MKKPRALSWLAEPRLSARATVLLAAASFAACASAQTYEFRRGAAGLVVQGQSSGQVAQPALDLSSASLNFGNVATHTTETRQVLVNNPGTGALSFTALPQVLGDAPFSAGATSCGATLAAGGSCVAEAVFSPTEVGSFSGTLRLSSALAGSPHDVSLTGVAYNPVSLAAATLPRAKLNRAYPPYDFKTVLQASNEASPTPSLAAWQLAAGALPAGMSFDTSSGVLSGTPTQLTSGAGASFTVVATYKNNQGQRAYTLRVGEAVLDAVQLSTGGSHACAVSTTGAVKCWGLNDYGQLGDGTTQTRLAPVEVVGLSSGVLRVSTRNAHSCALLVSGALKCWGRNTWGQLGDGTTVDRWTPVDVAGLSAGVSSVSAGNGFNCAVTSGGAVKCWGSNSNGQLGVAPPGDILTPFDVPGLSSGVAAVSSGGNHACAVTAAGAAVCWGRNDQGQLGDGTLVERASPQAVSGLSSGVAPLSTGLIHSCAVTIAGALKCWGGNTNGQLGDGTTTGSAAPIEVPGLSSGVVSVSAIQGHTCAVTASGGARCWGFNGNGRLGDGTTQSRLSPVSVSGLSSGVRSIVAGLAHTCAVLDDDTARCWGSNTNGSVGDGTTTHRTSPVAVVD